LYIPRYPQGFFVWFEIDEDLRYHQMPVKRIPFPRKSLGYHVHFVIHPKQPDPAPVDTHHALMVVGLAAAIHDDPLMVRRAAWRMLRRVENHRFEAVDPEDNVEKTFASGFEIMDCVMWHPEPLRFVKRLMEEMRLKNHETKSEPEAEIEKPKRKRSRSAKRARK